MLKDDIDNTQDTKSCSKCTVQRFSTDFLLGVLVVIQPKLFGLH